MPTLRPPVSTGFDSQGPSDVPSSPAFPLRLWALLVLLTMLAGCGSGSGSLADPSQLDSRLAGRVFDQSTGRELAGAFVSLDSGPRSQQTLTSPEGTYSFLKVPTGNYRLTVDAGGYRTRFQSVELQARVYRTVDVGLLPTTETGDLSGVVVDARTGARLAGAVVSIPAENLTTVTDSGGRFVGRSIDAGSRNVQIWAVGYAPFEALLQIPAGAALIETFRLTANAGSVIGTVLSTQPLVAPRPLAGVLVKLLETTRPRPSGSSVTYTEFPTRTVSLTSTGVVTQTAADGSYRLDNVTAGLIGLLFLSESHDEQLVTTTVVLGKTTVASTRLPYNRAFMRGTVKDLSGAAVAGARVSVMEQGLTTTTNAAGQYDFGPRVIVRFFPLSWRDFAGTVLVTPIAGTYEAALWRQLVAATFNTLPIAPHRTPVGCEAAGFDPGSAYVNLEVGGTVVLDFVLRRATGNLTGQILSLRTGVPIPSGVVSLSQLGLTTPVSTLGTFAFFGLPRGFLTVNADSVGYMRGTTHTSILPGQTSNAILRLSAPGVLQGTIRKRSSAAPIAAARVILPTLARQALTDTTGQYAFSDLAPGTFSVQITAVGQTSVTTTTTIVDGQTTQLDVTLDP